MQTNVLKSWKSSFCCLRPFKKPKTVLPEIPPMAVKILIVDKLLWWLLRRRQQRLLFLVNNPFRRSLRMIRGYKTKACIKTSQNQHIFLSSFLFVGTKYIQSHLTSLFISWFFKKKIFSLRTTGHYIYACSQSFVLNAT